MTEDKIEQLAIEKLQALGYKYFYGPDISPDGNSPEHGGYGRGVLIGVAGAGGAEC